MLNTTKLFINTKPVLPLVIPINSGWDQRIVSKRRGNKKPLLLPTPLQSKGSLSKSTADLFAERFATNDSNRRYSPVECRRSITVEAAYPSSPTPAPPTDNYLSRNETHGMEE
ncbi:hypothetical protein TNCT_590191 [Trichonephila clavata]|uniref:Uncharacterized protein n=1 Tax=Trichonephila clavata TaxID=2740835 RepID=A0A8X6LWK9_TRICU|nr:hypothetical protein TNCT_590191 [Trichonephila clavata]